MLKLTLCNKGWKQYERTYFPSGLFCVDKNCGNKAMQRGLCHKHLRRRNRYGDPFKHTYDSSRGCKSLLCNNKHSANGFCRIHDKEQYQINLKKEVYKILNQWSCVRCGFSDKRALQFDHIHGDGHKLLKIMISSTARLRYYIVNPEITKKTIQVLCANCNWIKRAENKEYGSKGR